MTPWASYNQIAIDRDQSTILWKWQDPVRQRHRALEKVCFCETLDEDSSEQIVETANRYQFQQFTRKLQNLGITI